MLPTGPRRRLHRAGDRGDHRDDRRARRTDSTSLSAVPKVWIAHSLTGPGREIDDRRADRGARVGVRAERHRGQLGDAERDRRGGDARQRSGVLLLEAMHAKLPTPPTRKPYRKVTSARLLYRFEHSFWKGSQMEISGKKADRRRRCVGLRRGDRGVAGRSVARRGDPGPAAVGRQGRRRRPSAAAFHEVDVTDFDGTEKVLQRGDRRRSAACTSS